MLPITYFLTFTLQLGYSGIWIGTAIGNLTIMIAYLMLITRVKWKKLMEGEVNYNEDHSELETPLIS